MITLITTLALAASPEPATAPVTLDFPAAVAEAPAAVTPAPRFQADDEVRLRGPASDIFAAGDTVYVDEPIGDNAFLAGEDVFINSPVGGDVFAAGETLHINALVHGDVYALGADVVVGPEGRVDGHLLAGGSRVSLQGPVAGTVRVGAGHVLIAAPVGGDVWLEAGELVLEGAGHIGGDLDYATPSPTDALDGRVDGRVTWTQVEADDLHQEEASAGPLAALAARILFGGWSYGILLAIGSLLLLIGGVPAARAGRLLAEQPSRSLGFGLAGFVMLPMLSVVACVLVLPLPLGLLGLAVFLALLFLAQLVTAQAIGGELLGRLRGEQAPSPYAALALGLVPLVLLASLPWVGGLAWLGATVLGGGALWLRMRESATA